MEDNEIVQLFWRRDEEAIAETDRKYGKRLQDFSKKIVWDIEDARECVNDTYLRAWRKIPPEAPSYLLAYLMKICRYVSWERLDYQKAEKRNAQTVEMTEEWISCLPGNLDLESEITAKELAGCINRFLGQLPEQKRRIFLRRYWFSDSVKEIAERMGMSETNVKQSLFRTRKSLREYLSREGYLYE